VFFAIVLVLLVALGETFREKAAPDPLAEPERPDLQALARKLIRPLSVFALLLVLMNAWSWSILARTEASHLQLDQSRLGAPIRAVVSQDWQPEFKGATEVFRAQV